MKKILIGILLPVVIIFIFLIYFRKGEQTPVTPTPVPSQAIVGNDRDAHGCIGSAGYSWCEQKQKCLRPWEESCTEGSISPTIDETEALAGTIKQELIAKHGESANSLTVKATEVQGDYAKGTASGTGGGGLWFAAKRNNNWKLIWDGNGIIQCSDLTDYPDFPNTIIPQCFDKQSDKLVKR